MNYKPYKHLPPFKGMVLQNFPFIEEDFDAITNYQLLCKVVEYLKNVIANELIIEENITNLYNSFTELKNYVDNYFTNLDVQEEINNKLDEMVEDGTLEEIIKKYFYLSINDNFNFFLNDYLLLDQTEEYDDSSFTQLQGFCYVNEHIIMGLRNDKNNSNYVKLVEYNPYTKQIIRSNYLILYHCNSITYNKKDNKLYIACTSMVSNGTTIQNNDIIVLDYNSFNTIKTISVDNLPLNHRIRSVCYDNEDNILYAGDITTLFKIDEENDTITETIELETTNINLNTTNQVLKKIGKFYVGLWFSYIAFWNLDKKLIKVINIERDYTGQKVGEVEDFELFENGDIILGSITTPQQYVLERKIQFFKSNIYTNTSNIFPASLGGINNPTVVYVDNTSNKEYEDGTFNYPFKNLQDALNVINELQLGVNLHLYGNNYDFSDIQDCNDLTFVLHSDITIDGLNIRNSKVNIYNQYNGTTYSITINGIRCVRSELIFVSNEENKAYIYPNENQNITTINGRNKCIYSQYCDIYLNNVKLIGNDSDNIINSLYSNLRILNCVFNYYNNHYAINLTNNSICQLSENIFSIGATSTQHLINVNHGSVLFTQQNLTSYNQYSISYNGKIYGAILYKGLDSINEVYFGNVTTVNTEYRFMQLVLSIGGSRTNKKIIKIPTNMTNQIIVDTVWDNGTTNKTNLLILKIEDGILKIKEHYYIETTASTKARTTITDETEINTNYSSVYSISYHD